jgi:hypothetical protein
VPPAQKAKQEACLGAPDGHALGMMVASLRGTMWRAMKQSAEFESRKKQETSNKTQAKREREC